MGPRGVRLGQVGPGGVRWGQVRPGRVKWGHVGSRGATWGQGPEGVIFNYQRGSWVRWVRRGGYMKMGAHNTLFLRLSSFGVGGCLNFLGHLCFRGHLHLQVILEVVFIIVVHQAAFEPPQAALSYS